MKQRSLYITAASAPAVPGRSLNRRCWRHTHMQFYLLKSKIHRATVTGGNVRYEGSLTIASDLMDRVGMVPHERILCSNMANGNRFETYAIPGKPGSGDIVLNGAAALLGRKGDQLTIMSFTAVPGNKARRWKPRVIVLGKGNRVANRRGT
jgi:aspartate 1-decarboxylase